MLLVPLLLLAGGFYWLVSPDLPPRPWEMAIDRVSVLASETLGGSVPFLPPPDRPMPKLDPQIEKAVDEVLRPRFAAALAPKPGSIEEKEAQIRSQLQATRLPITGSYILPTDEGDNVLAVGVRYQDLTSGKSMSAGLQEGFNALIRLVDTKTLSLGGVHDVTLAVQDDEGRILFGISAPVSTIEAYRAGKATQRDLIRSAAFKGESRAGMVDALRKLVTP